MEFGGVMALRRALALILVSLALTACSERPRGILQPVALQTEGTSRVDMLVATTRQALPDDNGEMFSGERARDFGFADIAVSIPPDSNRVVGDVQWPKRLPADPMKEFVTVRADRIDLEEARTRFHVRLKEPGKKGRALVFVHGFNNRFEDVVMRYAQIVHDSRAPVVPVLFTWPSRGQLTAYTYDRESANYSRDALYQLLAALCRDPQVSEISILAHSMGNWVTMEALRTMALREGKVNPKIGNIMLASPDVDVDVFRTQMRALGDDHPAMTLFVARDDKALQWSTFVWGDVPRLGVINPTEEPFKTDLASDNIQVIDLSAVKVSERMGHSKFAEQPDVVRSIGARLAQGQVVTDQRVGVGESLSLSASAAGATIGGLTGKIVAAPLVVLEGPK
jgi:esterase/lipase superfamily enzyme